MVEISPKGVIAGRMQIVGGSGTDEEPYLTVGEEPICSMRGEVRGRAVIYR